MKAALAPKETERSRVPKTNPKSAALAADRYDKVMSQTVTGRFRREALALARARGEEAEKQLERDVFNYGDMLFQEAEMTRGKRDQWRLEQMRERIATEVRAPLSSRRCALSFFLAPLRRRGCLRLAPARRLAPPAPTAARASPSPRRQEAEATFRPQLASSSASLASATSVADDDEEVLERFGRYDEQRRQRQQALRDQVAAE